MFLTDVCCTLLLQFNSMLKLGSTLTLQRLTLTQQEQLR